MSLNKKILTVAFMGLVMAFASAGFAQIPADASTGLLRSQATIGAGLTMGLYFVGLALSGFGSALGLGRAVSQALEGIARQPEAAGDIRLSMIIGCALIEALTIYMLISPFIAAIAGLTISA